MATEENSYELPKERELPPDADVSFGKGVAYWNSITPDLDGILGGFPELDDRDIKGSERFLKKLETRSSGFKKLLTGSEKRGVDCGAGIGRVTQSLLRRYLTTVDIVEPVVNLTNHIDETTARGSGVIGEIYNVGLQEWLPERGKYTLIWVQWCVGHLKDEQLKSFLRRCGDALVKGGMVVLKENVARAEEDLYDELDSSVTRSLGKFQDLIKESGMVCFATEQQTNMPKDNFPVRMFALRPRLSAV